MFGNFCPPMYIVYCEESLTTFDIAFENLRFDFLLRFKNCVIFFKLFKLLNFISNIFKILKNKIFFVTFK